MSVGMSAAIANSILDSLCRGVAWTPPAAVFVQLHTADPGAAGTTAVATEADRIAGTFGTGAAGGAISNTAQLLWEGVAGVEDYTHWTAWDADTVGNFLFSGLMTANAVAVGDDFTIPVGDLDVSLTIATDNP